jgi:hypothetical protein
VCVAGNFNDGQVRSVAVVLKQCRADVQLASDFCHQSARRAKGASPPVAFMIDESQPAAGSISGVLKPSVFAVAEAEHITAEVARVSKRNGIQIGHSSSKRFACLCAALDWIHFFP